MGLQEWDCKQQSIPIGVQYIAENKGIFNSTLCLEHGRDIKVSTTARSTWALGTGECYHNEGRKNRLEKRKHIEIVKVGNCRGGGGRGKKKKIPVHSVSKGKKKVFFGSLFFIFLSTKPEEQMTRDSF
eukprot:TRINITY_DN11761_c0_g1_i1.p1 TRINITY_DN11761_c0_g1~~TRINITY_DN11761_c0_g1_i1.p1  ORF type:complete len:128 (-),score=2.34 TRINITY_DN11761_c0_g1_i1:642-1025(-)